MAISTVLSAQNRNVIDIAWTISAKLPVITGMQKQPGVAGAFTGIHDGVMIIAGGANFPDKMPWEGGNKMYRDEIYVLQKNTNGKTVWIEAKTKHLPRSIAYGASVSIADGIVCVGGETENAGISKEVFMLQWDAVQKNILFKIFPTLPVALANTCVTSIGKKIYVAGGQGNEKSSDGFFMLDLSIPNPQWQNLPPLPVAMSHSLAVSQSNGTYPCIYLIGGRSSSVSGISELHNSTSCFDTQTNQWKHLSPISDGKTITNLSAATGIAFENNQIILIGGDKGDIFHRIEIYNAAIAKAVTKKEKTALHKGKMALLNKHPGFNRDVYLYNTVSNTWRKAGTFPFYPQVTTTAVKWDDEIFIASGEIKPGVRTINIARGKIISGNK